MFANGLSLQPGQHIVVARTPTVFTSIYGAGINLAHDGYGAANLSNTGETITLRDAAGGLIVSFTYGDGSPWPAASDGDGPSLEIIDPRADHTNPANWRASALSGGSPGWDGTARLAGDYDGSGAVGQIDYEVWRRQFGTSVQNPGAGADGNANGVVDLGDYVVWRNNLGATSAASAPGASASQIESLPELTRIGARAAAVQPQGNSVVRSVVSRRAPFSVAVTHIARDQALLELVLGSHLPRGNPLHEDSLFSVAAREDTAAFDLDDLTQPDELPELPYGFIA